MFKYSIRLFWSEEDESYIATIPEFPGLSAHGETPEEAAEEAKVAAELFVEDMEENGERVPEPQVAAAYSGQLRLRLPRSLHQSLVESARREGVSLNAHLVTLLAENFGAAKTADIIVCIY